MIEIVPAILISEGKSAFLTQGNTVQLYPEDPLSLAQKFEAEGYKHLHLVDLDGAVQQKLVNIHILQLIHGHTNLQIDFGGGITFDDELRLAFEYGAAQVSSSSIAVLNKNLFNSWVVSYGQQKMILSVDFAEQQILLKGRQVAQSLDLISFLTYYYERGVKWVKLTDLSRQTTQLHDFTIFEKIKKQFPEFELIVGGGVQSYETLKKLEDHGISRAIVGRAFYESLL